MKVSAGLWVLIISKSTEFTFYVYNKALFLNYLFFYRYYSRLRVTILNTACSLGLPACLSEASKEFTKWMENPSVRPHPDVRETVYYYGMFVLGNEELWNKMWNLFVAETDASEKVKLMYGLSAVQEPWILSRYVVWSEKDIEKIKNLFDQFIGIALILDTLIWPGLRRTYVAKIISLAYKTLPQIPWENQLFGIMFANIGQY